jgi:hypothetical protein
VVQLYFLNIGRTITVTTTGKTGGQTTTIFHGCFVTGLIVNGRSARGATRDFVFGVNSVPMSPVTLNSCLFEWLAGRFGGMTFNGACVFRIIGNTTVPTANVGWSVNGTSTGICTGDNFKADNPTIGWTLGPGTSVEFAGCALHSLTVAAGATADIRSSECLKLTGPGPVNRRSFTKQVTTTAGDNLVTFDAPFPDTEYRVSLQLTEGPGNPLVMVPRALKRLADFTINDTVGGNTYDVTVIHD